MKRRDFIAWLSGAAAGLPSFWPLLAHAQAPLPANQADANNSVGPQPLNRPQRLPGQRPRKNIFNEPKR